MEGCDDGVCNFDESSNGHLSRSLAGERVHDDDFVILLGTQDEVCCILYTTD
jgi:hypothetical protein